MTDVRGPAERGFLPRRHHDKDSGLAERLVGFSVLAEYDLEKFGLRNEGGESDPLTMGDDQSWVLWRSVGQATRPVSSFSVAFSAVVVTSDNSPKMVPIYTRGTPDDRYETKTPEIGQELPRAVKFPVGTTGHVSAGMVEDGQEDIFHPDWTKSLVAVGADPATDTDLSDEVYDVNSRGGLHPTRHARLDRLMQALQMSFTSRGGGTRTRGPAVTTLGAVLVNDDGMPLSLIDNEEGSVGLASFLHGNGPFRIGCTRHRHGVDDMGRSIHPLHLSYGALWHAGEDKDGPLNFDPAQEFLPITAGNDGVWAETFLRFDRTTNQINTNHDGSTYTQPGVWRWQTKVPFATVEGPNAIPSFEGTRTRSPQPQPGGGGSGGGGVPRTFGGQDGGGRAPGQLVDRDGDGRPDFAVWDNPGFKGRKHDGRQIDQSRKGAVPPDQQNPPWQWPNPNGPKKGGKKPQGGKGKGKGGKPFKPDKSDLEPWENFIPVDEEDERITVFEDTTPKLPDPTNKNEAPKPKAVSPNEIGAPAYTFITAPTADDQVSLGGTDDFKEELKNAPGAGELHPTAIGDGTKDGTPSFNDAGGWPQSEESALTLIGGGNDIRKVRSGEYDPCDKGSTPNSVVRFNIPAGMASIDTGHPTQSRDAVTTGGHRIAGSSACPSVLEINPVSSAGVVDSTVGIQVDTAGVNIVGTLKNNGTTVTSGSGKNSIGGPGDDGAITLSANTSYGAVVNATTWTLNATYNVYAGVNKPLVVKSTGAHTLNGSVLAEGRGWIEPA